MPEYIVYGKITGAVNAIVDADTKEEAVQKANEGQYGEWGVTEEIFERTFNEAEENK